MHGMAAATQKMATLGKALCHRHPEGQEMQCVCGGSVSANSYESIVVGGPEALQCHRATWICMYVCIYLFIDLEQSTDPFVNTEVV